MCLSCNIKIVPVAEASQYPYSIPIQEVQAKNSRCMFQVWYCSSPEKVNIALKPYGLKIDDMEQMKGFADYYDRGEATAYYKVDFKEIFDNIDFTQAEKEKTECSLVCTY